MTAPLRLTQEDEEAFARDVDALGAEVRSDLGDRDRAYILRVIRVQRSLLVIGRLLIFASIPLMPWFFHHAAATRASFAAVLALGILALAAGKILENMEVGHNVLHGQWDWMNDPKIHSSTWEWDNVCPAEQWKHSHNVTHHTWTNVVGKDRDVGYQILRMTEEQPWHWSYLFQPFYSCLLALLFQWGVALHDIDFESMRAGKLTKEDIAPKLRDMKRKAAKQLLKDYVLWPLLAGPFFFVVLLANWIANALRNVWAYMIIFCGHFPSGVHMWKEEDARNETRGAFFVRQICGSCNIAGGTLLHVMAGNLSHQIEHHLFPDLPSNRHAELAPRVKAIAARYGLPYNSGSLVRQFGTTTLKIWKYALPTRAVVIRRVEASSRRRA